MYVKKLLGPFFASRAPPPSFSKSEIKEQTWLAAQPPIDGKQLAAEPMPMRLSKLPIIGTLTN